MRKRHLIFTAILCSIIATSCVSNAADTQPPKIIKSGTKIIISDLTVTTKSPQEVLGRKTVLLDPEAPKDLTILSPNGNMKKKPE